MEIWGTVALFVLGIVLTVKGGDLFVDAPSWIAEVSGIPKFIIGATIVSLATTMPELLVSLLAAGTGQGGHGHRKRGGIGNGKHGADYGPGACVHARDLRP